MRHCQEFASRRTRRWTCSACWSTSRKYSLRSMPAENESPAPVSTSTPTSSFASSSSSTSTISALSVGFIALRFSGRCSSTQAMPSSTSTRTVVHVPTCMTLPPDLVCDVDDETELCDLLVDRESIAFHGRREAALGRQAELIDVDVLSRLLDAALDRILLLELAALGRDETEHDLLALGKKAQRSEPARALVVPLHEEAVDLQLVEERLGDEVVASLGRP